MVIIRKSKFIYMDDVQLFFRRGFVLIFSDDFLYLEDNLWNVTVIGAFVDYRSFSV